MSEQRPFQVDLRGVIDLLGRYIYTSPRVFARELLQNGRDAIVARHLIDPAAPAGRIHVTIDGSTLSFSDNGIGLTADEAADLLATVGRSSKRDELLGLRRDDFLGQFGIGLLSCFLVSDDITVRSRSAAGGAPIEWVGSADGTFAITEIDEPLPVGTTVALRLRPDEAGWADHARLRDLVAHFGEFLPDTILVGDDFVSRTPPFLSGEIDEVAEFGRSLIGVRPLDVIPLDVPGTGTRGVAYVLPFQPPPGARQSHRVYLGRMLLGERVPDLLPDWAFFVRCVVNTETLSPTASREALVENEALTWTRDELGHALRRWIVDLAESDPGHFHTFVAVHQLALKSMALHDDELARALLPHILIETSAGRMTIGDLMAGGRTLRYTETVDEFRQVAAVVPDDDPVVNAGYTLDADLMRRLPHVFAEASSVRLRVQDVLARLDDVPPHAKASALALEHRAEQALAAQDCEVITRVYTPHDIHALYVSDPAVLRRLERGATREAASPLWASVLGEVDDILSESGPTRAQLCLNWSSTLVSQLVRIDDPVVFDRSVRLLYVQALLASHHPLRPADRALLGGAMCDLIQLSVLRPD